MFFAIHNPCCDRRFSRTVNYTQLKVLGNGFELANSSVRVLGASTNCAVKAVVNVVMHQSLLGVANGALNRLHLLSNL